MADNSTKRSESGHKGGEKSKDLPVCGLILPISETANHSEEHWTNIRTLLHRGIAAAGFDPQNVWENTSKDRISERIIGNIFQVPLAVADISDLNPNVMLELGLRLASKKPTVVVSNARGDIPFDIRDFHAVLYPADMNMLGMEDFFRSLAKALQEKHAAYQSDKYTPFLGHVIVDVVSPETREVEFNELLLTRLDEITQRLSSVESEVRKPKGGGSQRTSRADLRYAGTLIVEIPENAVADFISDASSNFEIDNVQTQRVRDGVAALSVSYSGAPTFQGIYNAIQELAKKHGGDMEIPF